MRFNFMHAQRARTMKRKKVPMAQILAFFKHRYTEADIDQLIEELRVRARANYIPSTWTQLVPSERTHIVPDPEALAQQERRVMLRPKSLTALICGDPLPGESALDRAS